MVTGPTPDFDRVTLRWRGVNFDGTPCTGKLQLTYNSAAPLLDDDASEPISVYPAPIVRTLQETVVTVQGENGPVDQRVGYASFTVPVSDDPDVQGSGGTYTLVEQLDNGRGRTVTFVASKDTPGGIIYLNRLTSVAPVPGEAMSAVSVGDFAVLTTRVTNLELGGGGQTGGGLTSYSQVKGLSGYPVSFPPDAHSHPIADVVGLTSQLDAKTDLGHQHQPTDVVALGEWVDDRVAGLLAATTGITLTYEDNLNRLTVGTSGAGGGASDPEAMRDVIGTAMIGVGLVSVTVNDSLDTITLSTTATKNRPDSELLDLANATGELADGQVPVGFPLFVGPNLAARPNTRTGRKVIVDGGTEPSWLLPGDVHLNPGA